MNTQLTSERKSDRELVVSCTIDAPPATVFEAWANAEVFREWWVPKEAPITLTSCELDVRTGGTYRLVFQAGPQSMAFFGKYLEVIPASRMVWTNDEEGEAAATITTVTIEEINGATRLTVHDRYPSKDALDAAIESGSTAGMPVQLEQLNSLITAKA